MSRQQRRRAEREARKKRLQAEADTPSQPSPETPPADLNAVFQEALRHHGAGQMAEAVALYDKVLQAMPNQPDALHLKGVAVFAMGARDEGIALVRRAIGVKEDSFDYHNNLGNLLWQTDQLADAEAAFRRAIGILPGHAAAHNNLGGTLNDAGRYEEALGAYRDALRIDPSNADTHGNMGVVMQRLGDLEGAEAALRRSVEMAPGAPEAHNNLGNVLKERGDLEGAEAALRRAVELSPEYVNALQNLGNVLIEQNRISAAVEMLERAVALQPENAPALVNLGAGLNLLERQEEGVELALKAISLVPGLPEAHNNLGVALRGLGYNLAAEDAYREAVRLDPGHSSAHSNLIFTLDFNPAYGVADHQAERRRWHDQHAAPLAPKSESFHNDPDPERRLRIGYVSADFRRHSAANGFGPMILSHDRDRYDVVCYASNLRRDDVTEKFQTAATEWCDCERMSDSDLAARIRDDRIDILVDLSGHSAGNRLLVFARRPAPVQVTAWGHAAGTGLTAIDYFFSDSIVVPDDETKLYAEAIRYMPSHLPYMPPDPAPDVAEAPCVANGYTTFGSFNRLEKIGDEALRAWSQILDRAPESRLVIKSQALDRESVRADFEARLADADIDSARVQLLGGDPQPAHLAKHGLVDVMLDPFPHGGGISTADALWMGVPVITLVGNTIAGRIGASALHAIGLDDLIAESEDAYIELALDRGRDAAFITEMRANLRSRVAGAPVGDAAQYVAAVEALYREIWGEWCAGAAG